MIIRNIIKCPDGTILESKHRHDFVMHTQSDGREYFVDGGTEYQRIGFSDKEFKDLSITDKSPIEEIRGHFIWESIYDKNMNKLPEPIEILLKNMTEEHLISLCLYAEKNKENDEKWDDYVSLFKRELEYRKTIK